MAQLQKTSFSSFLNLSALFKTSYDPQKEMLHLQANTFLEAGALHIYYKMVANGYQPSDKQQQKFETELNHVITHKKFSNKHYDLLGDLVQSGFTFSPQQFVKIVFADHIGTSFILTDATIDHSGRYPGSHLDLFNQLQQLKKQPEYSRALFETWQQQLFALPFQHQSAITEHKYWMYQTNHGNVRTVFDSGKQYLFQDLSMSEYLEFSKKVEQVLNEQDSRIVYFSKLKDDKTHDYSFLYRNLLLYLSQNLEKNFSVDVKNIIQATQINYLGEHLDIIAKEAGTDKLAVLPEASVQYINDIKNNYGKLANHTLSLEDQHNLHHLVDEKLPQILKKYLSMDSEYRTTMKDNQGKNADDLLNESLFNISSILQSLVESVQQNALTELKVESRYTQSKNKL